jgi:pSer/pThr/pTyr-binding forkhead associated (FHA) protein
MDKTQPALIVQHGNTAQKERPIDRAGMTLGQARGCDIELDAPEVSNIHCVITRGPDGLYIRDCNSRTGTRVNGERIREAYLHDDDVLQIGPFSFQIYLPKVFVTQPERGPALSASAPASAPAQEIDPDLEKALAEKEGELEQKEKDLQNQLRDFEQKKRQWEETKNLLAKGQDNVKEHSKKAESRVQQLEEELKLRQAKIQQGEQELAKRQSQIQQTEKELKQRQTQVEKDIQTRLKESQQRCQEMEQAQTEALTHKASSAEHSRELDLRKQELDKYARQLQTLQQRLREDQEKLNQERQNLQQGSQPLVAQPVQANHEGPDLAAIKDEILAGIAGQQEALVQLQNRLQEQPTSHEPADFAGVKDEILAGVAGQQEALAQLQNQLQDTLQKHYGETAELLGELKSLHIANRDQQTNHVEILRQAILLIHNQMARGTRDSQPTHASATDLSTAPVDQEHKPKDKLAERLRAIEAKIPAVGSRSRHG